jgi:hypothetical protein
MSASVLSPCTETHARTRSKTPSVGPVSCTCRVKRPSCERLFEQSGTSKGATHPCIVVRLRDARRAPGKLLQGVARALADLVGLPLGRHVALRAVALCVKTTRTLGPTRVLFRLLSDSGTCAAAAAALRGSLQRSEPARADRARQEWQCCHVNSAQNAAGLCETVHCIRHPPASASRGPRDLAMAEATRSRHRLPPLWQSAPAGR